MSLEQALAANTAALEANTAALLGAAGKTTTTGKTTADKTEKAGKTEKSSSKSKHTKAEMQAALNDVKEQKGTAVAKKLIKEAGFDKLADVTEDKFDELYDAAKAELGDGEGEGSSDDGL